MSFICTVCSAVFRHDDPAEAWSYLMNVMLGHKAKCPKCR